jgi:hypothetical protein
MQVPCSLPFRTDHLFIGTGRHSSSRPIHVRGEAPSLSSLLLSSAHASPLFPSSQDGPSVYRGTLDTAVLKVEGHASPLVPLCSLTSPPPSTPVPSFQDGPSLHWRALDATAHRASRRHTSPQPTGPGGRRRRQLSRRPGRARRLEPRYGPTFFLVRCTRSLGA